MDETEKILLEKKSRICTKSQTARTISGIDIIIRPGTRNDSVHVPVILSKSGLRETVYHDFYVGGNCDVLIIAGAAFPSAGDRKANTAASARSMPAKTLGSGTWNSTPPREPERARGL